MGIRKYLLYITMSLLKTCKVVLSSLFVMLYQTDKNRKLYFDEESF